MVLVQSWYELHNSNLIKNTHAYKALQQGEDAMTKQSPSRTINNAMERHVGAYGRTYRRDKGIVLCGLLWKQSDDIFDVFTGSYNKEKGAFGVN
jgi:hypothetical protein